MDRHGSPHGYPALVSTSVQFCIHVPPIAFLSLIYCKKCIYKGMLILLFFTKKKTVPYTVNTTLGSEEVETFVWIIIIHPNVCTCSTPQWQFAQQYRKQFYL